MGRVPSWKRNHLDQSLWLEFSLKKLPERFGVSATTMDLTPKIACTNSSDSTATASSGCFTHSLFLFPYSRSAHFENHRANESETVKVIVKPAHGEVMSDNVGIVTKISSALLCKINIHLNGGPNSRSQHRRKPSFQPTVRSHFTNFDDT